MKKQISLIFLSLFLTSTIYCQVPSYLPEYGLVGWWPFNSNAQDESGNGNEGQVFGATLTNDRFGIPNAAYEFNDNYIVIPDNSIFNFTNLSFSLWVKTNSQNTQSIFKKCNYVDASNEVFGLGTYHETDFGGRLTFASKFDDGNCVPGVGWHWAIGQQNISDNQYHHIVCTVDENIIKMYVDGIIVSEAFSDYSQISSCFGGDFQIGRDWSGFNHYYHGVVDDIGIWNRVLTRKEVDDLYRAPSPETTTNTGGHVINNFDINLDIYPNPTIDVVNIDFHDLNKFEGGKVKIMNMSGQIVYEENITQSKMTISVVDRFSKGIYVVTTTDSYGNILSNEKMIVQ
jgi:hypothetical protein